MAAGLPVLDRRETVARLLQDRGALLVVTGLGSATYDVAAAGDDPRNFYLSVSYTHLTLPTSDLV